MHGQWLVTALLTFIGILFAGGAFLTYRHIGKKAKLEINSIETQSQKSLSVLKKGIDERSKEIIKNLNQKIEAIESEFSKKIKATRAIAYYDIAVENINQGKHKFALEFLHPLYHSDYRLLEVCFHMGICYENLGDNSEALKFFGLAKEQAEKEERETLINTLQRKIDEIQAKMKKDDSP